MDQHSEKVLAAVAGASVLSSQQQQQQQQQQRPDDKDSKRSAAMLGRLWTARGVGAGRHASQPVALNVSSSQFVIVTDIIICIHGCVCVCVCVCVYIW